MTVLSQSQFYQYILLMRWHKPIGIFLLLWPTLWALWIASQGPPDLKILVIFVLGVIIMRSAGCVINDFADRNIDRHVSRTKQRPLTAGKVSVKEAIGLFIVLCLLAFVLVWFLNPLSIAFSFLALGLAILYPFMKRYTFYPQIFLGLAFGCAIPMAFAAETNQVPMLAWWLFLANLLWVVAYDTMYAMADRNDDLKIGVKSTAIVFAEYDRLIIGCLQFAMLLILAWIGDQLHFTWIYFGFLVLALGLAIYQQLLIKDRQPQQCFQAFLNNHWLGMAIFLGLFIDKFPLL